jgi:hypothetical protein
MHTEDQYNMQARVYEKNEEQVNFTVFCLSNIYVKITY